MAAPLSRLSDPTSPAFGAVSAAAMGALSLIDPTRMSPAGRIALRAVTATTHGVWTAASLEDDLPPVSAKTVVGVLAAGASWSLVGASWKLDQKTVGWLARHGVRHPRRWLAASSVVTTLAMHLADRVADRASDRHRGTDTVEEPSTRPLAPAARRMVRSILTAEETADAAVLLTQLDTAEEVTWTGDPTPAGELVPYLELRVSPDAPRVVPHRQLHPVRARFDLPDGTTLEAQLSIEDGRLDALLVDALLVEAEPAQDASWTASPQSWPAPDRLRLVKDSPRGGVQPV